MDEEKSLPGKSLTTLRSCESLFLNVLFVNKLLVNSAAVIVYTHSDNITQYKSCLFIKD